ncbi:hypothetical protein FGO68_gene1899 [Halteria grandinella]|uniref:Uncharacterized protein n=1 Tax=Halteria grandinella TaxID=5974 RepID=A0A8J8NHB7_HALGN|nr:hypothetical protein FGO68_gene1899 [Halteria grandinella]
MSLLMLSIIMQMLIIFVKPMESQLENITTAINEMFVSLYLYGIISMSSGVDKSGEGQLPDYWTRDFCGLWLVVTVISSVVFNIGKFTVVLTKAIYLHAKSKSLKNKYLELNQSQQTQETSQNGQKISGLRKNDIKLKDPPINNLALRILEKNEQKDNIQLQNPLQARESKQLSTLLKNNLDQLGELANDIMQIQNNTFQEPQLEKSQMQIPLKTKSKGKFAKARKFLSSKYSIGAFENETKRNESIHQIGAAYQQSHSKMTSIASSNNNYQHELIFAGGCYQTFEPLRRKLQ